MPSWTTEISLGKFGGICKLSCHNLETNVLLGRTLLNYFNVWKTCLKLFCSTLVGLVQSAVCCGSQETLKVFKVPRGSEGVSYYLSGASLRQLYLKGFPTKFGNKQRCTVQVRGSDFRRKSYSQIWEHPKFGNCAC